MPGAANPFSNFELRPYLEGDYAREKLALAYRNSALPLEALRNGMRTGWATTPFSGCR
jgi:hypothetical protein